MKPFFAASILCFSGATLAAPANDKDINNYLVDITGGAVSAIGLIDAQAAAITRIETSQDVILALTPFASQNAGKNAFGIAITPAKTTLLPMPGKTYVAPGAWYARLAGNLTLSYAQNQADHAGQSFRQMAFAIDTVYFFKLEDDPVYQASKAYKRCADLPNEFGQEEVVLNGKRTSGELSKEAFLMALEKLNDRRATELTACIDADIAALAKARWNSGRLSASFGDGRIRPVAAGAAYALGKSFNLNAQYPLGEKGVAQISLRYGRRVLDKGSLGAASPTFKSSSLAAVRLTYGDQGEGDLRAIVEVSNARSSAAGAYKDAFLYAIGVDKKITKGTWLEFRLGRNRTTVDGKEQGTALLALNLSPSLFDYKK
jgi:hypothetical protein